MIETGLKGKVVLVSWANHRLGATVARAFAGWEAEVILTYLRVPLDEDGADVKPITSHPELEFSHYRKGIQHRPRNHSVKL